MQSEQFIADTFDGSLPTFIAAFTRRRSLSAGEIEAIRRMIDTKGDESR
ncbi:MAG: BlaI/MecI/CopY family transcriptional regulator [Eubacteriales bacterium]|nr:BlaI/MecI/CopY family transcriptional regulator [Eubacteriales bacterium]